MVNHPNRSKRPKWQPISDYRHTMGGVLLYFPEKTSGRTLLGEMHRIGGPGEYPHREPSHFMPLPDPPLPNGERDGRRASY